MFQNLTELGKPGCMQYPCCTFKSELPVKKKHAFLSLGRDQNSTKATAVSLAQPLTGHSGTGNADGAVWRGIHVPFYLVSPENPSLQSLQLCLYLHDAADDHGQNIQGKSEDVKQGQGHESFLGVQDVVLVNGHVDGKCRQGHL